VPTVPKTQVKSGKISKLHSKYISDDRKWKRTDTNSVEEGEIITKLDCRGDIEGITISEKTEDVNINPNDTTKIMKVLKDLEEGINKGLIRFLRNNKDMFAQTHSDMVGIDPRVMSHALNIDPQVTPVRQKKRQFDKVRSDALKEEFKKLLTNKLIREVFYPKWLASPVLVKKSN